MLQKSELFRISIENIEWFRKHYERLKKEYDNRWIVIKDKKVIGSASTFDEAMNVAKKHNLNEVIVEYIQRKPIAMFF